MTGRLYAIGDVHGRADLLEAMLAAIDADAEAPRIVFLGDIVDRGPDSRAALDLVARTLAAHPGSRFILGNHDEYLLDFGLSEDPEPAVTAHWLRYGGAETLVSYGLDPHGDPAAAARRLRRTHPRHLAILRAAGHMVAEPPFALVHAGIDPALPLDRQDPRTTRWIRDEFLDHPGDLPAMVVHGHTQTRSRRPEIAAWRIGIDTGAYATGRLTCLVLEDGGAALRFLATRHDGRSISVEPVEPLVLAPGPAAALRR